jgi:hypothetical protein
MQSHRGETPRRTANEPHLNGFLERTFEPVADSAPVPPRPRLPFHVYYDARNMPPVSSKTLRIYIIIGANVNEPP